MATFNVLKGAALGKAISGQGKAIATFTAREHQLAYSAIAHLDEHNDVKYLNALYDVTPVNYRAGLRAWAAAFSKAKFDRNRSLSPLPRARRRISKRRSKWLRPISRRKQMLAPRSLQSP